MDEHTGPTGWCTGRSVGLADSKAVRLPGRGTGSARPGLLRKDTVRERAASPSEYRAKSACEKAIRFALSYAVPEVGWGRTRRAGIA